MNLNLFIKTTFTLFFFVIINVNEAKSEMLPQSDDRMLTQEDISGFDRVQLRIARNEILARKGYNFKSTDLKRHFSQFSWYQPRTRNVSLTRIEKINIDFIKQYEKNDALYSWLHKKDTKHSKDVNNESASNHRGDWEYKKDGYSVFGIKTPKVAITHKDFYVFYEILDQCDRSHFMSYTIASAIEIASKVSGAHLAYRITKGDDGSEILDLVIYSVKYHSKYYRSKTKYSNGNWECLNHLDFVETEQPYGTTQQYREKLQRLRKLHVNSSMYLRNNHGKKVWEGDKIIHEISRREIIQSFHDNLTIIFSHDRGLNRTELNKLALIFNLNLGEKDFEKLEQKAQELNDDKKEHINSILD